MIQALLVSNILCLFISTEVSQNNPYILFHIKVCTFLHTISYSMLSYTTVIQLTASVVSHYISLQDVCIFVFSSSKAASSKL